MRLNFYASLTLYETPSKLYIQPRDAPEEALVINRQTGDISLNQMFSFDFLPHETQSYQILGIVGIKHLIIESYLIVITKACFIGYINGHSIFRVEESKIIPIAQTTRFKSNPSNNVSRQTEIWENTYINMLQTVLKTPHFYFSHTYDLTNSVQRNQTIVESLSGSASQVEVYSQRDKRFHWNNHLMTDFDSPELLSYKTILILGFISINENALGHGLDWILVSRRSVRRAGTRYNSRGIDHEGNVANFVETEQIIERGNIKASFVQIRGSIPLFWSQKPGYKYKPAIVIHKEDHIAAMMKHFSEIIRIYEGVSIACLIDQRGHEGDLGYEFGQKISQIQECYNVAYHYFDFHKECSKMRWHRLSILLERLKPELSNYSYFAMKDEKIISKQTGVIRSNCIDSLDRTNVIQSMIAQIVLQNQLSLFGDNISSFKLSNYPIFMDIFKNAWADNADALSIQYASTPALKTDFTRTGQRTHTGIARDGINSLTRYISNNYLDGYRQDAIDLFLGNYEGYPSPLYRPLALAPYNSMGSFTLVMITLVAIYFYLRWDSYS